MKFLYLDASVWVKRYLNEPGSQRIVDLFDSPSRLVSSALGYVEVAASLSRRSTSRIPSQETLREYYERLDRDWRRMSQIPMTPLLFEDAVALAKRYRLRGADSIHLAAALKCRFHFPGALRAVTLLSADRELLSAAANAGLTIENPATLLQ